jgi:tripartite ATP-independent transporter DctM subunit
MVISLVVFFITFIFGLPIAFSLILSSAVGLLVTGMPLIILAQKVVTGMDSFPLLAIFFFILAGNLMMRGKLIHELLSFANLLVGRFRGGLIYVNVLSSVIFAGLSGSAVADTAALGMVEIPLMVEDGYTKEFSVAVTIASSIIGPIIPPSIMMVILAMITNVSVGALFLAGFIPGILIAIAIAIAGYFIAGKRHKITKTANFFSKESLIIIKDSLLALLMPVIILGGILGGIFTATEAAAVASVYGLLISTLVKRAVGFKEFKEILISSLKTTTNVMIIIGSANIFCYFMIMNNLPKILTDILFSISNEPPIILFLMVVLLLFMGCFIEAGAVYIIMTPLLKPIALLIGLHPIHFSLIIIVTTCIGLITPPFGLCLFVGSSIGNISIQKLSIATLPFILIEILVLLIICYFPMFSLFLPKIMGFM